MAMPGPVKSAELKDNPPSKRLKIAMVIDTYDEGKNGAVISTNRFTELLRKDHDVSVITTGKSGPGKVILPGFYPPFFQAVGCGHLSKPVCRKLA